jgi:hypothetical protein
VSSRLCGRRDDAACPDRFLETISVSLIDSGAIFVETELFSLLFASFLLFF